MPTVSAHVARTLSAHIDHVFGVMGNGNAYFLDALERETAVDFTAVRHEAGGVVAADAYHRASGRLAAATSTYGAGFTNTLTALAEAVQAHVPLILVVGDEPTSGRRPWGVDQIALASAVGARTYTVGRTDAAATTVIAIEHALTYRVPTVLALPYDVAALDAGPIPAAPEPRLPAALSPRGPFAEQGIRDIAAALAGAKRPFLLAGRGAWVAGAGDALGALADATGALTASTALGRGIFPRSEFDLGVTGGFGAEGAMELIRDADVAVVFGASLNQFTMRFGDLFAPGTRVFQIDVAGAATHPHVGGFVRADAAVAAGAIVAELEGAAPSGWRESVDLTDARRYEPGDAAARDGRLDPRSVAARIGELLPEDRVVVSDGGHFIGWANMYWPVASPDRMIMVGTAFQSIGLGFPSVPGAALAKPGSTDRAHHGRWRRAHGAGRPRIGRARRGRPRHGRRLERRRLQRRGQPLRAQGPRARADAHSRGRLRGARRRGRRRRRRGPLTRRSRPSGGLGRRGCGIPPVPPAGLPDLGLGDRAIPAGDHPRELVTGPVITPR